MSAFYEWTVWGVMVTAAIVFIALFLISAPYGRHARPGWGPMIGTRAAWVFMESPALFGFLAFFGMGDRPFELVPVIFACLWCSHYVERTLIYPWRMKTSKRTPFVVATMGFTFNIVNAYVNGTWIASTTANYQASWLLDPRFLLGVFIFALGWVINRWADAKLRSLRRDSKGGYQIPRGGLYEWISCPNYAGEMLEWCGWALATWSLAGLSFALFTIANLLPRAIENHRWYRSNFPDYPTRRRAAIPFLV